MSTPSTSATPTAATDTMAPDHSDWIVPTYKNDLMADLTKGKVDKKLRRSDPYNFFLSPISDDLSTFVDPYSLSFAELLDPTLGELAASLHINHEINYNWLLAQYSRTDIGQRFKSLTLIYNHCYVNLDENDRYKNLSLPKGLKITQLKYGGGKQQSKISIFAYTDGSLRVVVMSANLHPKDWLQPTQGIWVSPKFPLKGKNNTSDDSKTDFKKDILRYLKCLFCTSGPTEWIKKIEKVNFSQANVFFIPSVPGEYTQELWGHLYLKSILEKHASLPYGVPSEWPLNIQCSSLEYLGATETEWLTSEFVNSLSASTYRDTIFTVNNRVPFNVIYPTVLNVLTSWNRGESGKSLLYDKSEHLKQLWLKNYMCLWSSESRNRTKAIPHLQTYCRVSPCHTHMSWFLLTEADLSKGSWGTKHESMTSYIILSYNVGVLFLPKFVTQTDTFCIDKTENGKDACLNFPLPYDLPLIRYDENDTPWNSIHKGK